MIRIRRDLSCWIAHKRSQDGIEEELEKYQITCATLRTENLRKDNVIRRLTSELETSRSYIPPQLLADFVLNEIPRKRAAAIERNRQEFENREGTAYSTDLWSATGCDEIDSQAL